MIKAKYYRYAMLLTAIVNMSGAFGLVVIHESIFRLLKVPAPVDHMEYFYWVMGFAFSNGVLAFYVYLNPMKNSDLLKVGTISKGLFSLLTIYFYLFHEIHWFFLGFGIWDGIFTIIFWLYLLKLQSPLITRMNNHIILPSNNKVTKKALFIYYSLTGSGATVAKSICKGLETEGYTVTQVEVKPKESELFTFPFNSLMAFLKITIRAIIRVNADIEPLNLNTKENYDLILLGGQTWLVGISAPLEAIFKDNSLKKIIKGKDIVIVNVCRGLWRRSQAMMFNHVKSLGGKIIAAKATKSIGTEPSRLFTLFFFLAFGRPRVPKFLSSFLQPRSGMSDKEVKEFETFGEKLAKR